MTTNNYSILEPLYDSCEDFEQYYRRVKKHLPNFPKSVMKQWLFDHFQCVINQYTWLGFANLSFHRESWPTDKILNKIKAWNEPAVESWKQAFFIDPRFQNSSLGKFMLQEGTWPEPPLILNNSTSLHMPDNSVISRWELIEGHHRLAYFRSLFEKPEWPLSSEHNLWIITPTKLQKEPPIDHGTIT